MQILEKIILNAQSNEPKVFEEALLDLRLMIERYSQNRYGEDESSIYSLLFHDKNLIQVKLNDNDLDILKYFLIYALFNFPDRAILVAKCIKVLFDISLREAICSGIEIYMKRDDHVTCELIFGITNVGDYDKYLKNDRIKNLLEQVSKYGGKFSQEAALVELKYLQSM